MPPQMFKHFVKPLSVPSTSTVRHTALFSASARSLAGESFVGGIEDLLPSSKSPRSSPNTLPSRPPSSPLRGDSTNPSLLEIPPASPLPRASRPAGATESQWRTSGRSAMENLNAFGRPSTSSRTQFGRGDVPRSATGSSSATVMTSELRAIAQFNAQSQQERREEGARRRQIEGQASRTWRDGDIYAPHDLSWEEMQKARIARQARAATVSENTRKKGGRDVLDDLGIDPLKEYKNFSLMSEFMTETGKIRHSRDTGLRAVNQRRMAKAVRRAIGIGIMPSVHKHPELFPDRLTLRGHMRG